MAASSSTAAQFINNQWYDVFLNHRGPDVKETFARSLYLRLLSHGLRAFLDTEEMQPGYNISCQLEHAIRTATVHVAIFSPGYAESYWCLHELVLMLESKAPIIPVFYRVTPSEVRWTQGKDGKYARGLQQLAKKETEDPQTHEMKLRFDSNTIEKWRNALSCVADNSGFELKTRNGVELELELLDELVECLSKMVKKADLYVAKYSELPRRLWHWTQNVIDNLWQRSSRITVRGIRMVLLDTEDDLLDRIRRRVESPNLIWLRLNKCPSSFLSIPISMINLRFLQVSGCQLERLWEDESQLLHISKQLLHISKL